MKCLQNQDVCMVFVIYSRLWDSTPCTEFEDTVELKKTVKRNRLSVSISAVNCVSYGIEADLQAIIIVV